MQAKLMLLTPGSLKRSCPGFGVSYIFPAFEQLFPHRWAPKFQLSVTPRRFHGNAVPPQASWLGSFEGATSWPSTGSALLLVQSRTSIRGAVDVIAETGMEDRRSGPCFLAGGNHRKCDRMPKGTVPCICSREYRG
eukprot:3575442-Amphidinium_carterae.1